MFKVHKMQSEKTFGVMGPLYVGDRNNPKSEYTIQEWKRLDQQLKMARSCGISSVSTDVWWGEVEKVERQYDWSYYDELQRHIEAAGLKWVAIISLHQCGGNIGDDVNIPLPGWIWDKTAGKVQSGNIDAAKYVSEQGNASNEYVSCWATDFVLDDYKEFFAAFQRHFAHKAKQLVEINISLGPAGELRFPSYNAHDTGSGYPSRGALQCYSELARLSFLDYVMGKYHDHDGVESAWGEFDKIEPPYDAEAFYAHGNHADTQYGRDLIDWYSSSLLSHGRKVLNAAFEVFSANGAPFAGIAIGAKVPGVHWRMGHWDGDQLVMADRIAEVNAGLIRTSDWAQNQADDSHGYRHIIGMFSELQAAHAGKRLLLHFTCLEMTDGENESLAGQLVKWFGAEATHQNVIVKGENALSSTLGYIQSWNNISEALTVYQGITVLRLSDVMASDVARAEYQKLIYQNRKVVNQTAVNHQTANTIRRFSAQRHTSVAQ